MPRRVDFAAHFAFVREASFAIVHERGVHHLSRRSVAAQLGVSDGVIRRLVDGDARLERLAADEVVSRRRTGRFFPPRGDGLEVAVRLVMRLVPEDETRAVQELVWLRLMIAGQPGDPTLDDHTERREQEVVDTLAGVLDLLRVPESSRDEPGPVLRALVDGLTLAVCTGRLSPEEAHDVVSSHLLKLSQRLGTTGAH